MKKEKGVLVFSLFASVCFRFMRIGSILGDGGCNCFNWFFLVFLFFWLTWCVSEFCVYRYMVVTCILVVGFFAL